ncbi:hypothetical protein CCACVL1_03038, partial [Corchorus capsularis]
MGQELTQRVGKEVADEWRKFSLIKDK